ncbi:MAG: hypothetical protein ACYDG5_08050, partial [Dehalococcoidales bacterium]
VSMEWHNGLSVVLGILSIPNLASKWVPLLQPKQKFFISLGFILAILAIIFAVIPFPGPINPPPEIKITSPLNDAVIPMEISVKGYSTTELPNDEHLYIVVEYGGMWWPQFGEMSIGYSQNSGKYEFNTPARVGKEDDHNKPFNIRAVLVDSAVHQYFQSWFQQNKSTEDWQGISIVETKQRGNVDIKDSVSVVRQ